MSDDSAQDSDTKKDNAANRGLSDAGRMSFGDHLEELRNCLIAALFGIVLATIVCLIFGRDILELIFRPLLRVQYANGLPPRLQVLSPTAGFAAYLKIGFLSGLILAMPWVLHQMWKFVSTGLYKHERRFMSLLVPVSLGLFVVGVVFLYVIVLPIVLQFFIRFNQRFDMPNLTPTAFQRLLLPNEQPELQPDQPQPLLRIPIVREDPSNPEDGDAWLNTATRRLVVETESGPMSMPLETGATAASMQSEFAIDFYISFVLMLSLAFGIAFETPIVVFFLAWTGIVSRHRMARGRRYVLLATVVAAAMLTPPDVISQLLLAGPMYVLFEAGLLAARLAERKAEAEQEKVP